MSITQGRWWYPLCFACFLWFWGITVLSFFSHGLAMSIFRHSCITWRGWRAFAGCRGRRESTLSIYTGTVQLARALVQGLKEGLLPTYLTVLAPSRWLGTFLKCCARSPADLVATALVIHASLRYSSFGPLGAFLLSLLARHLPLDFVKD